MKKDVKLYNMILPTFMLMAIHPLMWLLSITGNFVIDSVVLLIVSLVALKKLDFKMYKSHILLVYIAGFVADFIGALYLFFTYITVSDHHEEITNVWQSIQEGIHYAVDLQSYESIWGVLFMVSGVFVAQIFIFFFDYMIFNLKGTMSKKQSVVSALMFAILTAPYTYFLPVESFNWYFGIFGLHA